MWFDISGADIIQSYLIEKIQERSMRQSKRTERVSLMACTAAEHKMEELYAAIEKKIKASGYPREISGADVYDDICDQIEGKENGSYILLSKFEDDVIFEYHITVMDDDFNLGVLTMRTLREYLRPILMNKRTIQTRSGRRVCHTKYPVR